MKSQRHPHPHVDSRQPRNQTNPGTNPPIFAWRPITEGCRFHLRIASDKEFKNIICEKELKEPIFLPDKAFMPGEYFWKWADEKNESEIFSFSISTKAVLLEVPLVSQWSLGNKHPCLYFNPLQAEINREKFQKKTFENQAYFELLANRILLDSHQMAEPPFLPNPNVNYKLFFDVWYDVAIKSRKFISDAEILALMYQLSGDVKFGRAACERMVSVSKWDPHGSSHVKHNDEAHMSIIWNGAKVVDWVYELFSDKERELVINQFRHRGKTTFEHLRDHGVYGVSQFDSHNGREIIFLGLLSLVFYDDITESKEWLDWLRPVLCGIWPVWGNDDGGWAQGPSYATYVHMMTMFATALKNMCGVDLYKRPFWINHARWRQTCWPAYAEWIGFGDHTEKWEPTWQENISLIKIISFHCQTKEFDSYLFALENELKHCRSPENRKSNGIDTQVFLLNLKNHLEVKQKPNNMLKIFPNVGWAAIRTEINNNIEDLAFIFRSSPYGAISHSHANNNDMIVHVAGKAITTPAGYYDGYGSPHHTQYNWHTKSHNCITLSGAGQIIRGVDSVGEISNQFEDENIAYFCGIADKSYRDRAQKCRRHVCYLKAKKYLVLVDEFVSLDSNSSSVEFNLHSWAPFQVNEESKKFVLSREGSGLQGHFLYHYNSFFTLSEGWDPKPKEDETRKEWWLNQYHMKFTTCGYSKKRNLTSVLIPFHKNLTTPSIKCFREGEAEIADIEGDIVWSNQLMYSQITANGITSDALAVIKINETCYQVYENGIKIKTNN